MTKHEALKQALEALETNNKAWKSLADSGDAGWWEAEEQPFFEISVKAITAIKEALAQPEKEPVAIVESVATVISESGNQEVTMSWWHEPALPVGTKLYTTPPQRTWVGLTDEEVDECYYWKNRQWTTDELVRHVEAKLKEKNT